MNEERTITLPVDKVRHAVDMITASLDFGSDFYDQEDTDFLRDLAVLLGDVCPQAVTPTNMRHKYPPCAGTETWKKDVVSRHEANGWPLDAHYFELTTGHNPHPYPEQ